MQRTMVSQGLTSASHITSWNSVDPLPCWFESKEETRSWIRMAPHAKGHILYENLFPKCTELLTKPGTLVNVVCGMWSTRVGVGWSAMPWRSLLAS